MSCPALPACYTTTHSANGKKKCTGTGKSLSQFLLLFPTFFYKGACMSGLHLYNRYYVYYVYYVYHVYHLYVVLCIVVFLVLLSISKSNPYTVNLHASQRFHFLLKHNHPPSYSLLAILYLFFRLNNSYFLLFYLYLLPPRPSFGYSDC